MKNALFTLSLLVMLAACGKNASGDNSNPALPSPPPLQQGFTTLALPPECRGPTEIAMPSEYQRSGCTPYGWEANRFGQSGCPRQTFAACATRVGLICVPQDAFNSHEVAWTHSRRGAIGRACIVGATNENGLNICGDGYCQALQAKGDIGNDDDDDHDHDHDDRHDNGVDDGRDVRNDFRNWSERARSSRRPPRLLHIGVCVQ